MGSTGAAQAEADWEGLHAFVAEEAAADRFSGTVAVEQAGTVVFEAAAGHAHLGLGVPNDLDTRLNVASITKMFTAVAVLQLVEAGELSLEATVADLLPDLDVGEAARATVHDLLSHRSGLGDYWNARCWERRATLRTTGDYLGVIDGERPAFAPGSAVAYGNTGFVVLGGILERATGGDAYEVVRSQVSVRSGASRADHVELDAPVDFAHGYTHVVDWFGTVDPHRRHDNAFLYPVRGSTATGLYASVRDLLRFARSLRDGVLLSPAHVELMLDLGGGGGGLGYGTQRIPWAGGTAVGHGGRAFGAATFLLFLPEVEATVCVLSNYDRPADKRVFTEIERVLVARR